MESADLDEISLDAALQVLDEGSPVGWKLIADLQIPLYPTGALALRG